jgi:hypothetical protein
VINTISVVFFLLLLVFLIVLAGIRLYGRGFLCDMGDNQQRIDVVFAMICLLLALDHQRLDIYPIKLSYITKDQVSSIYHILHLHED